MEQVHTGNKIEGPQILRQEQQKESFIRLPDQYEHFTSILTA